MKSNFSIHEPEIYKTQHLENHVNPIYTKFTNDFHIIYIGFFGNLTSQWRARAWYVGLYSRVVCITTRTNEEGARKCFTPTTSEYKSVQKHEKKNYFHINYTGQERWCTLV